jgi:hypothetical protein
MANAIYTMVSETGRCFQLRADTEDTFRTLLFLGKSTFKEEMVDVVDEIRSKSEDEGDFCVSEFLSLEEESKEIPSLFKKQELILREEALSRLAERLSSGESVVEVPVEVELIEVPEEVMEEPHVEPEEVLEILVEDVRPRVNIKVIEGRVETEDHSSLFDE